VKAILDNKWIYFSIALYLIVNAVFTYNEFYWFNLLPGLMLIIGISLLSMDKLFMIIVFFTPLSVNLQDLDFGLGIALPTEPLIFGAMVLFLAKLFFENDYDVKVFNHPISYAILFHLAWMFFTSVTSTMPLVSFKYLLSRMWFVITFFYLASQIFRNYARINSFIWLYIFGFLIVIGYTIVNHYLNGFEKDPAHWVMTPFYNDHTSYGALLAMYIPLIFLFFDKKYSQTQKFFSALVLIIFFIAIVLSYTRAAWVSLIGAFGLFIIYQFRIKLSTLIISGISVISLFLVFKTEIIMKLEKNRQDSSQDLGEHVQSISNISSDASNLERLNRWNCAFRMFAEKPIVGFGPGTYMFQYAPYQRSKDLTIISTNAGDLGNAHSEYIGPLAEQGVLGSVAFLIILITVFYYGSKLYHDLPKSETKTLVLLCLLALSTYFIHGLLNNFLDTDKASVPFWGFIAIITVVDIYHRNQFKKDEETQSSNF